MQKNKAKVIRLTEAEFNQLIESSVRQVIQEGRFTDMAKKVGKGVGKAALYGALGAGSLYALDKGMENQEAYEKNINAQAASNQNDRAAKWLEAHDMEITPQNLEMAEKAMNESKKKAVLSMIIKESIHKVLNK